MLETYLPVRNLAAWKGNEHRDSKKRPVTQAILIQDALAVIALTEGQKAQIICQAANAWATIETMRQALIGFGKPKPVDAKNVPGKARARSKAGMIDPSAPVLAQSSGTNQTGASTSQASVDKVSPDAQDLQS